MTGLYILCLVGVLICPASLLLIILVLILDRILDRTWRLGEVIVAAIGVVLFIVGYKLQKPIALLVIFDHLWNGIIFHQHQVVPSDILRPWIFCDLRTLGVTVLIEQLCLLFASFTPERMMLMEAKQEEKRRLKRKRIKYVPKRSQIILGISGSGKSAYIGKSLEEIIRKDKNAMIYLIDGKGSTERYSLYYSAKLVAEKYGIPLTIINGTSNRRIGGIIYDFLDKVDSADAMKDLIMTLIDDPLIQESAGSQHYRTMTERYLIEEIEMMKKYNIDVTLHNVLTLIEPEKLITTLLQSGVSQDEVTELEEFLKSAWPEVRDNAEKLRMFLKGEGAEIFSGDRERCNLRKAYEKGGIVLVLADEMSCPKLAGKLVQLITQDLRILVAERLTGKRDMAKKVYVFYDEFSSYVSSVPLIRSLYAKCRSADVIMSLATQSCADITGLDREWFDVLCNTADRFVVFRQHAASAEAAAMIFGTRFHVTQTARSSNLMATGEGSNTLDQAFVIPPDTIRNLPSNVGFLLDKNQKPDKQVKCFRNQFLKGNKK